jgi:hypothetical protein
MSQAIGNGSQLTINRQTLIKVVARVRPGASHACILGANSGDRYLSVLKLSASAFQLQPSCFFQTTTYFPGDGHGRALRIVQLEFKRPNEVQRKAWFRHDLRPDLLDFCFAGV